MISPCKYSALLSLCLASSALGTTWHVDDDGADYENANFDSIQQAIDSAVNGDVIIVHEGSYQSNGASHVIDTLGKSITIQSSGVPTDTVIDCQFSSRGLVCVSGETADTIINGFMIHNGRGTSIDFNENLLEDYWESSGGGAMVYDSSPTIINCLFVECSTSAYGGGLYSLDGSPALTDCLFGSNTSENVGGGLHLANHYGVVSGCAILDNSAEWSGGGVACQGGQPLLVDCLISNNESQDVAGGLDLTPLVGPHCMRE